MIPVIMPGPNIHAPNPIKSDFVTFTQKTYGKSLSDIRQQLDIHLQIEVMDAEFVRRQANVWLLTHVGNLLRAESPELVLSNPLQWRFDIRLTLPNEGVSGPIRSGSIGKIHFDALTGEAVIPDDNAENLISEFKIHANQFIAY